MIIEDRNDTGLVPLQEVADDTVALASKKDGLEGPIHQLPRQHALALSQHQPHAGQVDERVDG